MVNTKTNGSLAKSSYIIALANFAAGIWPAATQRSPEGPKEEAPPMRTKGCAQFARLKFLTGNEQLKSNVYAHSSPDTLSICTGLDAERKNAPST